MDTIPVNQTVFRYGGSNDGSVHASDGWRRTNLKMATITLGGVMVADLLSASPLPMLPSNNPSILPLEAVHT